MSGALLIGLLMFEPCLEPQQAFVPFSTDVLNPLLKFFERFRRQGIALLPPCLMDSHEARIFEDCKMLEDSLPGNRIVFCELGRCPGAMFRQIYQQTPAHGISQRGEEGLLILTDLFSHHRHLTAQKIILSISIPIKSRLGLVDPRFQYTPASSPASFQTQRRSVPLHSSVHPLAAAHNQSWQ